MQSLHCEPTVHTRTRQKKNTSQSLDIIEQNTPPVETNSAETSSSVVKPRRGRQKTVPPVEIEVAQPSGRLLRNNKVVQNTAVVPRKSIEKKQKTKTSEPTVTANTDEKQPEPEQESCVKSTEKPPPVSDSTVQVESFTYINPVSPKKKKSLKRKFEQTKNDKSDDDCESGALEKRQKLRSQKRATGGTSTRSTKAKSVDLVHEQSSDEPCKEDEVSNAEDEIAQKRQKLRTQKIITGEQSSETKDSEPVHEKSSDETGQKDDVILAPIEEVNLPKKGRKRGKPKTPVKVPTEKAPEDPIASKNTAVSELAKTVSPRKRASREVDINLVIESTDAGAPIRQSRRIAQLKIREEADRRKMEEVMLAEMKANSEKKRQPVDKDTDFLPHYEDDSEEHSKNSQLKSKGKGN